MKIHPLLPGLALGLPLALPLALGLALAPSLAAASQEAPAHGLSCQLHFSTTGWSAIYERTTGEGIVTCDDGSTLLVTISAHGFGVTAGKWRITDGTGRFTHVAHIEEVLGSYLSVSGDAGLVKAATAGAMTKGTVSLVLAGTGDGFDVGVAIKDFRISRAELVEE